VKRGAPVSKSAPFLSEQPHDNGYHRGQLGMQYQTQTKTVDRNRSVDWLQGQETRPWASRYLRARGPNLADIAR